MAAEELHNSERAAIPKTFSFTIIFQCVCFFSSFLFHALYSKIGEEDVVVVVVVSFGTKGEKEVCVVLRV